MENNDYYRVQELVYNALMQRHEEDESFCFTLRKNFDRNTYKNYFTGTETSSYMTFSLWYVKNSYPGASVDPIVYRILQKDHHWSIQFQLHHTNTPTDEQNELVLEFLQSIGEALKSSELSEEYDILGDKPNNRMYKVIVKPKYNKFSESDLIEQLLKLIDDTKDFVDNVLTPFKQEHPNFVAEKIQPEDLQQMIKDREIRTKKIKNSIPKFKDVVEEVITLYSQSGEDVLQFQKLHANHIWIGDTQGKIGNKEAHYELLLEAGKKEVSALVHFETENSSEIRKRIGENLPSGFKWINWELGEGLKSGSAQAIDAPKTPQILLNALLQIERDLGQKIRNALDGSSTDTATNESAMNVILYGPPGTGKTYQTRNKSLEIIDPSFINSERRAIKLEYEKYIKNGQISFTTFHQSTSYEEFVEGIKPKTVDGQVTYHIEKGLFKIMVNRALYAYHHNQEEDAVRNYVNFDGVYNQFLAFLSEKIDENGGEYHVPLKSKGYSLKIQSIEGDDIWTQGSSSKSEVKVEKEKLRALYNKFGTVAEIKNIVVDIRGLNVGIGWHSNYFGIFQELKNFEESQPIPTEPENPRPDISYVDDNEIESFLHSLPNRFEIDPNLQVDQFVIIIDELNRGNVSNIFGELITLLEADKRLGKKESLSLTLAYSKQKFSVPPNLHIIGTMNTADRSVEALDTALRRRFIFKEMLPKPELLSPSAMLSRLFWKYPSHDWDHKEYKPLETRLKEFLGITNDDLWKERKEIWENKMKGTNQNVLTHLDRLNDAASLNLQILLSVINKRIEVLVDRDHTIGHSYFLDVDSTEKLKQVFENKIIPLLQEYFYGDYRKMEMVIGSYFFEKKQVETPNNFFAKTSNPVSVELETHHLKALDSEDFDIIDAVRVLMNEPVKSEQEELPNEAVNS